MFQQTRRRFLAATTAAVGLGAAAPWAVAADTSGQTETARLNAWLEERFKAWLARSPMQQAYLGLKTNLDKWDDIGEAFREQTVALARKDLQELRAGFKPDALTPEGRISYRLYEYEAEKKLADYDWRFHEYPVNQMFGWQQEIPTFLINIHRVATKEEAEAYVARLLGVGALMDQVIERMRLGEAASVLAPKFVYANVLRDARNVLVGAPFDGSGKPSPLQADIVGKIDALKIDDGAKQKLRADAEKALKTVVQPAFARLIAFAEGQQARANTDDGAWKHPRGDAYYAYRLKYETTTDMSAEAIHDFGLKEVERIRGDIAAIMKKVKFSGDMKAFFKFMREDSQFYYPQTDEGKAAYVRRAHEIIDGMRARLDELFITKPKAELTIKVVEPFREQSSTSAFYQQPGAFDGRPGIFYVNTYDMRGQPKYEMESLAYHEAIPGHHMQISIAQEMKDMPSFRRFGDGYTAYVEGWALYCERVPKELGFYQDPYSDFGRLSNELWRACRLVVDTGLHGGKWKWSREKAIAYLLDTTPNAPSDCENSIERYIVMPGQATSYKIGMTRILELREAARKALGPKFDIREYHEVVLGSGALTLSLLAENVDAWVKRRRAA